MVYEMLTSRPPFTGPDPLAVLNERLLCDPRPARELSGEVLPALQEILNCALERDPRRRYATAAEMAWDLEHQDQVGVATGEQGPGLRRRRLPRGRKMLLYAGLALVPVVLLVVMLLLARR